jgi:WhiB family redox-sensing transcriptional regulator
MTTYPCTSNPELFFGGHIEIDGGGRGGPSLEERQRAAHQSALARIACLRHCPLAQQRQCARLALQLKAEYGVWAGVQLPGGQNRKIPQLLAKREILKGIADATINPRTHPSNTALIAQGPNAVAPLPQPPLPGLFQSSDPFPQIAEPINARIA